MKLSKSYLLSFFGVMAAALVPHVALAAGAATLSGVTPDTASFSTAKTTAQSWAVGDLGIAIATVGGIMGTIGAVGGNVKLAASGVAIAALGAFTPGMIQSVYGAVI